MKYFQCWSGGKLSKIFSHLRPRDWTAACLEPTALVWTVSSLPELSPKEAALPGVAGRPRAGEKQREQWARARLELRLLHSHWSRSLQTLCSDWLRVQGSDLKQIS